MEDDQQTLWNFDGAELNLIFTIKVECGIHLKSWDLEKAYWSLRDLRREIDAKLRRDKAEDIDLYDREGKATKIKLTEKEMIDKFLEDCESERNVWLRSDFEIDDASRFYHVLEQFYLTLSFLMKKHGLYLREGADPSQAFRWR